MSVWQGSVASPLQSAEGDLLSVRITVEAFLLEDLLDALAEAPFPINPEIHHHESVPASTVEFPVWQSQLDGVKRLLARRRFPATALSVSKMLGDVLN